jgi:uncharacterized membrane protein YedE/YeeE
MIRSLVPRNKRGDFLGIVVLIVLAFIIITISVVFLFIQRTTETKLQETLGTLPAGTFGSTNASAVITDTFGDVGLSYNQLKWITVMLIFGMIIGIFIGSYMVTTKPVMFIPYIFMIVICVIISVGISNSYEVMMNNPTLASTFAEFTGANHFMLLLPVYISIIGFVGGIIMFVRWARRDEYLYNG